MAQTKYYHLIWRGLSLTIRHVANWGAGFDHIETTCAGRVPMPISETGYHSHFLLPEDIAAYGTAEDYVLAWLDEAATYEVWRMQVDASRQMSLF